MEVGEPAPTAQMTLCLLTARCTRKDSFPSAAQGAAVWPLWAWLWAEAVSLTLRPRQVNISQPLPAQVEQFPDCSMKGGSQDWAPQDEVWPSWCSNGHMSLCCSPHREDHSSTAARGARAETRPPPDLLGGRGQQACHGGSYTCLTLRLWDMGKSPSRSLCEQH